MTLPTLEKASARANSTMRLGDVWSGPSGAHWLVHHVAMGRAHLRRHQPRSTKGARFIERPVLAPKSWTLVSRDS